MSETNTPIEAGRADLVAWERARPSNFFDADKNFQQALEMYAGDAYPSYKLRLHDLGQLAANEMDRLTRETNRDENLPSLRRFDGIGTNTEEVCFPEAYHQLGAHFWRTGVLAALGEGDELLSGALTYMLDQNGEAGHACPVACTAGLIKLLQRAGTTEQQTRLLPGLLEVDYSRRIHAAQFITEVQGGSDVGQNGCTACETPAGSGRYRIHGEKWFCSVADASLFVMTARPEGAPEGTSGLGLFLVPRLVDGAPNSFTIRRLKVKLGTRSLASGEIDFHGALAEPLGPLSHGFKNLISIVLDTSRVYNALAACGVMRRALVDAQTFARHRRAFGRPIAQHPMVAEILARMTVETQAAVATTLRLVAMGRAPHLADARRTHVNINKYWTAIRCTRVVRDGIEVLGGNGTIEDFSILPRLYRDAIVLESWEGTHNTLCAQVLRDFAHRGLHAPWLAEVEEARGRLNHPRTAAHGERIDGLLAGIRRDIDRLISASDATYASANIRRVVDRMCRLNSYVSLSLELEWRLSRGREDDEAVADKEGVLDLFRRLYIDDEDPMEHPELIGLMARVALT